MGFSWWGLLCGHAILGTLRGGGGVCAMDRIPRGLMGAACVDGPFSSWGKQVARQRTPRVLRQEPSIVGPRPEERCGRVLLLAG